MTPEIIEAFGRYILIPTLIFIAVMLYLNTKEKEKNEISEE